MDLSKINVNDIQKKGMKVLIILGVVIVLFIVVIFISQSIFGTVLSYDRVEEILVSSAENYYNQNKKLLPAKDGESVTVDDATLTEKKFMKSIVKITKEEDACIGQVKVTKNGKYYIYTPQLKCSDKYATKTATETLKEQVVTYDNGLYANDETNEYVYKGEFVDNYVEYSGSKWRIIKITSDNTIRMIQTDITTSINWDDRYNNERKANVGINNFSVSRLRETLNSLYAEGKILKSSHSDLVIPQSKCAEYQKNVDENGNEFEECSMYEYQNQMFTTLYAEEFAGASLDSKCTKLDDPACANYNYLGTFGKSYWTMTKDPNSTYKVYKVDDRLNLSMASARTGLKAVIELSGNVLFESGDGTDAKPYKIKRFD